MAGLTVWRSGDPVEALVAARQRGALLFIPTESSYGIGVDPTSRRAVEAVYAFKGREGGKPLPVVLAEAGQVAALGLDAASPELAGPLARAAGCWPGPLTVILPLPAEAPELPAAAGSGGIAVRVPAHDGLRRLLAAVGPLTATSANASGEPPVTDAGELERWLARISHQASSREGEGARGCKAQGESTPQAYCKYVEDGDRPATQQTRADSPSQQRAGEKCGLGRRDGEVDAVLVDGGALPGGPPSTLVSFGAGGALRVLRPGRLTAAELEACLGKP